MAFGDRENQVEWYAMAFAKNQARTLQNNSSLVPLTAAEIAHNFRYISEDGSIATPMVERIQMTLDSNSATAKNHPHAKKWADWDKFCRELKSQHWFPVPTKSGRVPTKWIGKSGPINWVEQSAIGSTF